MAQNVTVSEALEILKDNVRLVRVLPNGEHIFKCPFCGDSDNPYHGHLYVSPEGLMNCYKCEMKGTVNRLLDIFVSTKYHVDLKIDPTKAYKQYTQVSKQLRRDTTNFEKYISDISAKPKFLPYFDIPKTLEAFPIYVVKNDYMNQRIIGDDKLLLPVWYKTNMTQQLCTYYSEHFMKKLIECGALSDNAIGLVNEFIMNRRTSILFIGYNRTQNIFKNDSEDAKYLKIKRNIYYGDNSDRDFFIIINQNKYINGFTDLYRQDYLNVYFAEGVFDALNLYLHNPKYITGVLPDIIVATGSKVSYPSALYYILDTFMKPIVSHCFLDPDIDFKKFINRYTRLKRVYKSTICYQNGNNDYGDMRKDRLDNIKICWR